MQFLIRTFLFVVPINPVLIMSIARSRQLSENIYSFVKGMDFEQRAKPIRSESWAYGIFRYVTALPEAVNESDYWIFNITNLAYFLISLLHTAWIFVFGAMGQYPIMYYQFVSIASFIVSLSLNRKGLITAAMILAMVEVGVHQALATACFGWSTGFQNFIPLIALMPFLKYNEKWGVKITMWATAMLVYLVIDLFLRDKAAMCVLTEEHSNFLNISNSVISFILVALWGIVLAVSYQRSVNALIRKEQELFDAKQSAEKAEFAQQLELKQRDNEIYQLRNVELKKSNDEILLQQVRIEKLVGEQELIIAQRTQELAHANSSLMHNNQQLIALIGHNAHAIREPLARIMGSMLVQEYISQEEFLAEVWPHMGKAVNDLDTSIKEVIAMADEMLIRSRENGKS